MKKVNNTIGLILIMIMAFVVFSPLTVKAESYTYRINIVLGGTAEVGAKFNNSLTDSLTIVSDTAKVTMEGSDCLTIYDLNYNDQVAFDPKAAVEISSETNKYYVKGMRVSGADNYVSKSVFTITKDDTYVIAYGVGAVVPYTVKYVDTEGNLLLDTATYYGTVGEEVYVPYRYIEGYVPDAFNIHTTSLEENQEFVFTYTKAEDGGVVYNTSISTSYDAVEGPTSYTYQTVQKITNPTDGVVNNRADGENAQAVDDSQNGETTEVTDDTNAEDDTSVTVEDEETPLGSEDIIEVDDEEVAKALDRSALLDTYRGYAFAILIVGILVMITAVLFAIKGDKDNVDRR